MRSVYTLQSKEAGYTTTKNCANNCADKCGYYLSPWHLIISKNR